MKLVDLRSDTVTRPTAAMRDAMLSAPLGDDVFADDPSVNALQARIAERLGKQAALFVPSGTQSNLTAIMTHCGRGDEYLVGQMAHTYRWEGGGAAVLGRDDIGQISAGKAADLAIFDVDRIDYAGSAGDPVASLLFCGASHRTKWTIVNGHVVVKDGRLVNADEGDIVRRANAACLDLLSKAGAIA